MLEVLAPGPSTTVQDEGRTGFAHVGVGHAGAADRGALRRANRLVGNSPAAAGLEVLVGGLVLRALGPVTVAVAGAPGPVTVDGRPVAPSSALRLHTDEVLRVGAAERGVRRYVAVEGGVEASVVLGSRSADALAGLGPAPLVAGQLLARAASSDAARRDARPLRPPATAEDGDALDHHRDGVWELPVLPGPQAGWFHRGALLDSDLTVAAASDRTAVRLEGTAVARRPEAVGRELAPAGLVRGAVQVPPDGRPVVFGPDHPVTGGYPVVAVVRAVALDAVGQLRPGDAVRFVE